ncbi:MAG: serine hydrolase domain-containing protein [Pseudobdellovibrionaceae bacterium]
MMLKYSVLEKNLYEKLQTAIVDVTPGVVVRAYQGGRIICDISVGQIYAYYDLASLTKIIFTTQAIMQAYDQGMLRLDQTVSDYLPWFPHGSITVAQLLTHSSGLSWWKPFYEKINVALSRDERRLQLIDQLKVIELEKHDKCVYSDVGFLVLGFILEKIYDKSLLDIWQTLKNHFYLGTTLEFNVENQAPFKTHLYAPTEECPRRKKLIQAEVHDENAWALGGVSTHAGLFGSIDDISWYALSLRSQLLGIARYTIRQKTTQLFTKRAVPEGFGDWALGYMLPSPGSASCGPYFSLSSIGHTGFTGTSIWYDSKLDLIVNVLSNRVLYGRDIKSFATLRPQIHSWIVEAYRKSGL